MLSVRVPKAPMRMNAYCHYSFLVKEAKLFVRKLSSDKIVLLHLFLKYFPDLITVVKQWPLLKEDSTLS